MTSNLITICALTLMPAIAVAQGGGNSGMTTRQDTGQKARQGQQGQDTVTSSAGGSIVTNRNLGLSNDQVKQLQQALEETGCNTGPVDGIVGPKTRAAIHCAEQQNNISGNDMNQLFQALNLDFTTSNASGVNADTTDNPAKGAVKGNRKQTSGGNAGRVRPIPDSSLSDTSRSQQRMRSDTNSMNMRDTSGMNMSDTSSMNMRDTSNMNMSDTSSMNMRDTSNMNMRDTTVSGGDVGNLNRSRTDTTGAMRDTTGNMRMNDSTFLRDTTNLNRTDTTGNQMRDTSRMQMQDTSSMQMRDTSSMRDSTNLRLRDTTSMRDTTTIHR